MFYLARPAHPQDSEQVGRKYLKNIFEKRGILLQGANSYKMAFFKE
jgi:hypothetical protein